MNAISQLRYSPWSENSCADQLERGPGTNAFSVTTKMPSPLSMKKDTSYTETVGPPHHTVAQLSTQEQFLCSSPEMPSTGAVVDSPPVLRSWMHSPVGGVSQLARLPLDS